MKNNKKGDKRWQEVLPIHKFIGNLVVVSMILPWFFANYLRKMSEAKSCCWWYLQDATAAAIKAELAAANVGVAEGDLVIKRRPSGTFLKLVGTSKFQSNQFGKNGATVGKKIEDVQIIWTLTEGKGDGIKSRLP